MQASSVGSTTTVSLDSLNTPSAAAAAALPSVVVPVPAAIASPVATQATLGTATRGSSGGDSDKFRFRRDEVLAYNPDGATLNTLVQRGYVITGALSLGDLRASVYRLTLPAGLDAVAAQTQLAQMGAEAGRPGVFGFNHLYRLFKPAELKAERVLASPTRPVGGVADRCRGDRCFNRVAIGWNDGLAACAKSARIGVLDTGANASHPSFAGQSITQASFVPFGKPKAASDHATAVLAVMAGADASGTPGLLPGASYFDAGVFGLDADKLPVADTFSLIAGLEWLSLQKVDVINMSFAGPPDPLMQATLSKLSQRGILLVAAAGNDGPTAAPGYPAAYPDVFAVTAIGKDLRSYRHANRGIYIDVAAPGVGVWTAVGKGKSGYQSGTSFAAPHLTAVLATLRRQPGPVNKAEILKFLTVADLGEPGNDPVYGRGLLLAPDTCRNLVPPDAGVLIAGTATINGAAAWTPAAGEQ